LQLINSRLEDVMDKIDIKNLRVYAHHGVLPQETELGQEFFVTCEMYLNLNEAADGDRLNKTVDYSAIAAYINKFMAKNTYKLIETAAHKLSEQILIKYPLIEKIDLEIHKPHAPIDAQFEDVYVSVSKAYHTVYLSVGSNIGDRKAYLDSAVKSFEEKAGTKVVKVSKYYETAPVGYTDQPDFLNSAVCIRTILSPDELLKFVHEIENEQNRERTIHWGPRTLDIDILMYDDLRITSEELCIPHLRMHERMFVLEPMSEIAPNLLHPVLNKTMSMLRDEIKPNLPQDLNNI